MNTIEEYDEVTDGVGYEYVVQASELTTTERIAIVTATLITGGTVTTSDVAKMTETSIRNARYILNKLSRVLPITCDDGLWFSVGGT